MTDATAEPQDDAKPTINSTHRLVVAIRCPHCMIEFVNAQRNALVEAINGKAFTHKCQCGATVHSRAEPGTPRLGPNRQQRRGLRRTSGGIVLP
jgi:hypothetical protein